MLPVVAGLLRYVLLAFFILFLWQLFRLIRRERD